MQTLTPEEVLSKGTIPDGATGKKKFIQSLYAGADSYYNFAPWKCIPGPWAMSVTVDSQTKYGEINRIAVVAGASNSDSRGLQIFPDLQAYSCMDRGAALILMYNSKDQLPLKHFKSAQDCGAELTAKRGKSIQCPVFVSVGANRRAEEDLVWYAAALPALGAFIAECARLGGGSAGGKAERQKQKQKEKDKAESGDSEPEKEEPPVVLSAMDVLCSVMEPDMARAVNPSGTAPSLISTFPCIQTITTSLGDIAVTISVVPSQTAVATAQNATPTSVQEISDSNMFKSSFSVPDGFEMNPAASRMCAICRKTDSDLRSRGGKGLQACVCRAPGLRYCSKECQKLDWKRHKKVCAGAPAKKNK